MGDFVQQFNLFNFDKEHKVITKPIRLIELFSGIGAQAKALEKLGANFEHWKTCEWAVNSIKSYNAIHIKDFNDYSKDLTKEQLIDYLDGNISTNYNEPCNVKRQNEKWLRDVYNNCIATHNLMNIMKVKGKDIERISSWNAYEKPLENVLDVEHEDKEISTLTTHVGKDSAGMKLIGVPRYSEKSLERIEKNIVEDDNAPCITANAMQSVNHQNCVLIKENNNQGYKEAHDGDGVNIASRMEHQRGNVQKGSIQTLKAQMEIGVVVEDKEDENVFSELEKRLFTKDGNINRYIGSDKVDQFKDGQMATTTYPNGWGHGPRTHDESIALNTIDRPSVKMNLRIRKLVPCETMKLMGFERCDYQAMREVGMSDSAIYHCSGDSIVTTCLMALLGQMLPISEKELKQKIEDYVKSIVEN